MLTERQIPKHVLPLVHCEQGEAFLDEGSVGFMQFRLVYEGSLKSSGNSSRHIEEKHAIRKQLHGQLSNLYDNHYQLQAMRYYVAPVNPKMDEMRKLRGDFTDSGASVTETLARRFVRANGFRFVPLVSKQYDLVCSLDILFLRRENPGDLILQSGDIDNRIKTLFDALRIPEGTELPRESKPEADEDPFFCLLENDSLITDLRVTTDRLLRPLSGDSDHKNNVVLVIHVNVKASRITGQNMALLE